MDPSGSNSLQGRAWSSRKQLRMTAVNQDRTRNQHLACPLMSRITQGITITTTIETGKITWNQRQTKTGRQVQRRPAKAKSSSSKSSKVRGGYYDYCLARADISLDACWSWTRRNVLRWTRSSKTDGFRPARSAGRKKLGPSFEHSDTSILLSPGRA